MLGMRVRLPKVKEPRHQPMPEHVGKRGTIIAYESVRRDGRDIPVPVIKLDDGATIRGYECWWEPIGPTGAFDEEGV